MQNETTLQNNEIYQNPTNGHTYLNSVSVPIHPSVYTTTASGGDSGNATETYNGEPTANVNNMVSSGDFENSTVNNPSYQTQTSTLQVDYTENLVEIDNTLHDIQCTLLTIMFFIVFAWCENKIRNAVRSFTGIGLK